MRDWKEECFRLAPSSRADIVSEICETCSGSGYRVYGNTATYFGGVGGCMMTTGVCDKCWGSGDSENIWPSHRQFYDMKQRLEVSK